MTLSRRRARFVSNLISSRMQKRGDGRHIRLDTYTTLARAGIRVTASGAVLSRPQTRYRIHLFFTRTLQYTQCALFYFIFLFVLSSFLLYIYNIYGYMSRVYVYLRVVCTRLFRTCVSSRLHERVWTAVARSAPRAHGGGERADV